MYEPNEPMSTLVSILTIDIKGAYTPQSMVKRLRCDGGV